MEPALMIVQFMKAALTFGLLTLPLLQEVSNLIIKRNTEGGTLTRDDLMALFNAGDIKSAEARKQFEDTLADPNTPKL